MCLSDRRLLSIVDALYKEKNGSGGKADEQTRKIAKGEIVHARHWFVRHSIDNVFTALCHFLGYIC